MKSIIPVSIVIPAYNGEKYIGYTIESVLNQTLAPYEIIVVDDGSSDTTSIILENYPVKVIRQLNKGICGARNTGIVNASCDWIALLDQDDIWLQNKLEIQWRIVKNNPIIDVVFTDFYMMREEVVDTITRLSQLPQHDLVKKQRMLDDYYLCDSKSLCDQIKYANYLMPSTLLVRKEALIRAGSFDEDIVRAEDRDLFLRMFPLSTIAIIDKSLVLYRWHDCNSSNDEHLMLRGALLLAEKVTRSPECYVYDEIINYFKCQLNKLYYRNGLFYLQKNDSKNARKSFNKSMRSMLILKSTLAYIVSYLPVTLIRHLLHRYSR